jgi:hypothetical protein
VLAKHVERVTGSAENPLRDDGLEAKVRGLAEGILPAPQTDVLIAQCWKIADLADAGALARAAVPQ